MTVRRRRDNMVVGVFAVLAILGGGHAILSFFGTPLKGPSQDSTVLLVGHAQLAGSYARDFVVAYLGASAGQHDQLDRYLGGDQQMTLPSTGQQVTDPSVVYITRPVSTGSIDIWAVTVSVRLGGPAHGAATATTTPAAAAGDRQYYRVAVTESGGLLRREPPAAVQPPGQGADLALGYTTSCPSDSPLATVSTGFLTAFLTGTGDITRYVSTTAAIGALTPAPFTTVDTVSVKSDDSGCGRGATSARTQIMVNPKGAAGAAPTLAYSLTMIRTAGEWQVQSIDSTPLLRQPMAVVAGHGGTRSALPGSTSGTATTTPSSPSAQIPPATQN